MAKWDALKYIYGKVHYIFFNTGMCISDILVQNNKKIPI